MATVWIPTLLQDVTGGQETVCVEGTTVRTLVAELEQKFPGVRDRLCNGDELKPSIAVSVDGEISDVGLRSPVRPDSEVHFLPAIAGGRDP